MGPMKKVLGACLLLACLVSWAPAQAQQTGPRDVVLLNITIFQTHEFFGGSPDLYFKCSDNDTQIYIPDVQDANSLYSFTGYESFQPLTTLPTNQCKWCGFYDDITFWPDPTFAEFELCPLSFAANGTLEEYQRHELDAIFYCKDCSGKAAPPPLQSVVLTPTAVPAALASAPTTAAAAASLGSNFTTLAAKPVVRRKSSGGGLSPAMLAVILVIVGLSVAALLLVGILVYYRQKAKRVTNHAKAVQELAYVEEDLKAGQVEKGLP